MWHNYRIWLVVGYDLLAASTAWIVAWWLRYNLAIPDYSVDLLISSLLFVLAVELVAFKLSGLYRGVWLFASLPDLRRIAVALIFSALLIPVAMLFWRHGVGIPRSVYIINPLILCLLMAGGRLSYRAWKEYRIYGWLRTQGKPVLLMGITDEAISIFKQLERSPDWQVIGIVDNAAELKGREVHGIPVLGRRENLAAIAAHHGVKQVIYADREGGHHERRIAYELCRNAGLEMLVPPKMEDLISGRVQVSPLRQIELEDLLGRDAVNLDNAALHQLIHQQRILITGAGGSIGAELCRQILKFRPAHLICLELSEHALYQIEQEFSAHYPDTRLDFLIADVKDFERVLSLCEHYRPQLVFHAAAYKHVPLMEEKNILQAIKNNAIGTLNIARAAIQSEAQKFVLVSTDKAVNPTNVMGATKRLAELLVQQLQANSTKTALLAVRFGNVLGSNGSVIPKFRQQIAAGGPITVTHPDIIRYFMTIPEAAQLILQAGTMGRGGEIFVLDMGEPVKIADLAKDLIQLSGFDLADIPIIYTGLRPGEKLFEELLANNETTQQTSHPKVRACISQAEWSLTPAELNELINPSLDEKLIREKLMRAIQP
ncbi:polysaccharide biosynthesis protein [Parvibium lacunae]|uniref:Polysaccharide biosynthesis protein n=2 Tax=Parvibium lacunae TaxID=1888893 RepID=A0A368L1V1_9BURK|nr:polysaccharide biosynthesis protein [Parvibium lacunae]